MLFRSIGKEGTKVKTKGLLKEVEVAKDLREANGVIVLSHVKGHDLAGYGGAIKNLGMGGVPAEEKGRIHDSSKPVLDLKKCVGCGLCAPLCINKAIKIINGKMKIVGDCFGCGLCIRNCPQQALKPKLALFPKLLTEAACAVLKNFKKRKVIFVNVLEKISKMCDCAKTSEIICPDIGILVSDDVVAIEQASVDLINKKTGKDLFFQLHKISPNEQIDEAEKLGLGERKYRLEKL